MIRFDLICANDHEFDSWFASNDAFDQQKFSGLVTCPYCNSDKVEKQLMSPGIPIKNNRRSTDQAQLLANSDPKIKQLADNIRKMRKMISENAENVGDNFAEEARKIHYQEKPARGIYGQASFEDAKSLLEEGIDVMPLPDLPEDNN